MIENQSIALFTDLYELTMLQAYFEQGMHDIATFSLFVRRLPNRRNSCWPGDLAGLAFQVRKMLDDAGLGSVEIFASSSTIS